MEIESGESSEIERKDDVPEVKKADIEESESSENKPESKVINNHEKIDDDEETNKIENSRENIDDSFKRPTSLIGPRRGKPGQSRPTSAQLSKETPEQSHDGRASAVDNENSESCEKTSVSANDKQQIPLSYKEPPWGGRPEVEYKIEVLKSGVILEIIDISEKSFHTIGRLPTCDISLAHPTISRYHAVLQYRSSEDEKHPRGFYLYDLGSTHGTFWNGCRIRPNTYARLQGGHMIRFGCSQRKFIMQTPSEDMEEESELSVTELKEKRRLLLLEREQAAKEEQLRVEEAEKLRLEKEEAEGIDWGMGEDADEETDLAENPYASTNNEELFLDDPKKTLRGWFEREGQELQYQTEEKGIGQFLCWVDLPIDGDGGRTVRAEAVVKGKKKESVVQCALEACRILDRHGVLRQANHEARKRKARNWEEEDFYDSDEDNFLDRTGTVEKKREQRMRQAGKLDEKIETYASLLEKHGAIEKKISDIENQLKKAKKLRESSAETSNEDALDVFMSSLSSTVYNKADARKMKLDLQSLKKEEEKLLKLVNITRPANLPSLTSRQTSNEATKSGDIGNAANVSKKRPVDRARTTEKPSLTTAKKTVKRENETVDPATKETNEKPVVINSTVTDDSMEKPAENAEKFGIESSINEEETSKNDELGCVDSSRANIEEREEKSDGGIAKKRMKNMKRMQQRAEKAAKETTKEYDNETYPEDYSMWLPPKNQSGDGKTSLNDKYGY